MTIKTNHQIPITDFNAWQLARDAGSEYMVWHDRTWPKPSDEKGDVACMTIEVADDDYTWLLKMYDKSYGVDEVRSAAPVESVPFSDTDECELDNQAIAKIIALASAQSANPSEKAYIVYIPYQGHKCYEIHAASEQEAVAKANLLLENNSVDQIEELLSDEGPEYIARDIDATLLEWGTGHPEHE